MRDFTSFSYVWSETSNVTDCSIRCQMCGRWTVLPAVLQWLRGAHRVPQVYQSGCTVTCHPHKIRTFTFLFLTTDQGKCFLIIYVCIITSMIIIISVSRTCWNETIEARSSRGSKKWKTLNNNDLNQVADQKFSLKQWFAARPIPIVLVKCWKVAHWNAKKLLKNCQKSKKLLPKFQKMLPKFLAIFI